MAEARDKHEQALECRRAYNRGYNAGLRGYWPQWMPPLPEESAVRRIMESAKSLRDAVDTELATLGEDDEWQTKLGDPMDEVTESLETVRVWLTCCEVPESASRR